MPADDVATQSASPPEESRRQAPRRLQPLWRRTIAAGVGIYALAIVALWLWMYREADRSWLATLFLFGPRWVCGLPLLLLVPAAAIWHRKLLWVLAIVGVLIAGPILGFELHVAHTGGQAALRVMSCNLNQLRFRPEKLAELVDRTSPDIVALQEVPGRPPPLVWPKGWHVVHRDEQIVASRFPIVAREGLPCPGIPGKLAAIRYTVTLPDREVQLFNLHLFSPRRGLEAVLDRKKGIDAAGAPRAEAMVRWRADESQLASDWIRDFPGPKIVVGDFNMPVESVIFRRSWSWLDNAFSTAGFGFGFTKVTRWRGWSYGTRIDHVLYTPPWRCVRSWIGPDIGSDHLPLFAEFE